MLEASQDICKLFNADRVDITMKLNSVEQWTLKNECTRIHREWHNFHIHQNPFQLVAQSDRTPMREFPALCQTRKSPAGRASSG